MQSFLKVNIVKSFRKISSNLNGSVPEIQVLHVSRTLSVKYETKVTNSDVARKLD